MGGAQGLAEALARRFNLLGKACDSEARVVPCGLGTTGEPASSTTAAVVGAGVTAAAVNGFLNFVTTGGVGTQVGSSQQAAQRGTQPPQQQASQQRASQQQQQTNSGGSRQTQQQQQQHRATPDQPMDCDVPHSRTSSQQAHTSSHAGKAASVPQVSCHALPPAPASPAPSARLSPYGMVGARLKIITKPAVYEEVEFQLYKRCVTLDKL